VTCEYGGTTPDAMAEPGTKYGCRSNDSSQLTAIGSYATFLRGLKSSLPHHLLVRTLSPPPGPLRVINTSAGAGLDLACGAEVPGKPVVRTQQLAEEVSDRRPINVCSVPFTTQVEDLASSIAGLLGHPCVERMIPTGTECEAKVGSDAVPQCSADVTANCFKIMPASGVCTRGRVMFDTALPANSSVTVRCRL
jgi:hypothetical protein